MCAEGTSLCATASESIRHVGCDHPNVCVTSGVRVGIAPLWHVSMYDVTLLEVEVSIDELLIQAPSFVHENIYRSRGCTRAVAVYCGEFLTCSKIPRVWTSPGLLSQLQANERAPQVLQSSRQTDASLLIVGTIKYTCNDFVGCVLRCLSGYKCMGVVSCGAQT